MLRQATKIQNAQLLAAEYAAGGKHLPSGPLQKQVAIQGSGAHGAGRRTCLEYLFILMYSASGSAVSFGQTKIGGWEVEHLKLGQGGTINTCK